MCERYLEVNTQWRNKYLLICVSDQPFCRWIMLMRLFFLKISMQTFLKINIYLYLQTVDIEEKYFGQNKLQNVQVIQSVKYYKSFNIWSNLTVWSMFSGLKPKVFHQNDDMLWNQIIPGKPKMKIWIKEPDKSLMSPHTWELLKKTALFFQPGGHWPSEDHDLNLFSELIWDLPCASPHVDTLTFTLTSGLFQCRYRTRPRGG